MLLAGGLAIALATLAGWQSGLAGALMSPPAPVRFLLAAAALVLGVWLLMRAAERLGRSGEPADMIRGVRLAFLAVAALAAAAGWALGSVVPVIAALVIAGVDVVESTFLLLVTGRQERSEPSEHSS